eukprot:7778173-Alexandrium_andersonii.AAC.1
MITTGASSATSSLLPPPVHMGRWDCCEEEGIQGLVVLARAPRQRGPPATTSRPTPQGKS